jgi:hypothetical protein
MKAIIGSWDDRPHRLIAENARLRDRVRDLEDALRRANEENAVLRATARDVDVRLLELDEVALSR